MTTGSDARDALALDAPSEIRAAAMLRESGSMSFDAGVEAALVAAAAEMRVAKSEIVRLAVREWLAGASAEPAADHAGTFPRIES
ncbi:hypothetical protein LB553_25940 [Mesorhizobium sp. CA8]|uniref:hypothetical protein n=1 Tax=unclassified Mesorhizobium TaxID=325217 RepID=UPI001CCCF21A|nr:MULTISPECIES: hypothetical protein [unclassified Mesorhizobium]MBZ9764289.1 hypothetical protein [Mesorhizobium sp. CA8]MBZ9822011.1 hypothetical protein [Mesorhizobium sp. CA4]